MMVTFVSQCEKNALKKTRRVLDAFANRIGDNTWQTLITEDGLLTVKKMLRNTASKSTAVSCHWIRSRSRSQFLWVVGNKTKFSNEGYVPVNTTEQSLVIKESFALNTEVIANLAALSGYFHDIGKANRLFQIKLGNVEQIENEINDDYRQKKHEPIRHEWVSMRLFQAFVGEQTDQQWLKALVDINLKTAKNVKARLFAYNDSVSNNIPNPFQTLPPIARIVAWLIVSHHLLPQFPKSLDDQPPIDKIDEWQLLFEPLWNSPQVLDETWSKTIREQNWDFPFDTPFVSSDWQKGISYQAKRTLQCPRIFSNEWHNNLFTQHLSRLSLMLADHAESSQKTVSNQDSDRNYLAYANTGKDEEGNRFLKQKLDEHNIHVGKLAYQIACDLPRFKTQLQDLGSIKALEDEVPQKYRKEFGWQNKAAKLASTLKETVKEHGFFGISMASTGKGKTRANAKIMYALSDKGTCRFNVALGLRTLSIQTAKALRTDLFGKDEKSQKQAREKVALLVGSQAVRDLQQIDLTQGDSEEKSDEYQKGSESGESLLTGNIDLESELNFNDLITHPWLEHDPKLSKLLHSPILVSTIDYLIPATDGVRGGKQIASMLRLLSSDLVLDEPDDFNSDDFPALCRLVHWAGMLGSKVLISTATIMPCEAEALFEAYLTGRAEHTKANSENGIQSKVCCAWFDECNKPISALVSHKSKFAEIHKSYVAEREQKLFKNDLKLRQAKLVDVEKAEQQTSIQSLSSRIYQSLLELHADHAITVSSKKVSIGLVRMANINPLVHVAKTLFEKSAPENTRIHYCVYHGQYPLLQRSYIEQILDKALKRDDHQEWLNNSGIAQIVEKHQEVNHIFVVIATSVSEVGRDHDYDWAVVEPSSMRSIIQLAGRVQRHRKNTPNTENIHVLSKNYKGLEKKGDCFTKPGFENSIVKAASADLRDLNLDKDLQSITASPRILLKTKRPDLSNRKFNRFSEMEHFSQQLNLYGGRHQDAKSYAARWWQHDASWNGQLQSLQPFRKSSKSKDYIIKFIDRTERYRWYEKVDGSYPVDYQPTPDIEILKPPPLFAQGVDLWVQFNIVRQVNILSKQLGKTEQQIYQIYTHASLQEYEGDNHVWYYQPEFGIYNKLK